MKDLDGVNTGGSNRVGMTIEPHCKDKIVGEVKSKIDTRNSYILDLFIFNNNYAENLPSRNLANVLPNFFGDLLSTSINFCFSLAFFVFSFHLAILNGTSGYKLLDSISFDDPANCNPGNTLAFYH